jgi:hypothetical protein
MLILSFPADNIQILYFYGNKCECGGEKKEKKKRKEKKTHIQLE